jgi:hypothetical protein
VNLKERERLRDIDIDGRIICKKYGPELWIWIHMIQDKVQWWAFVILQVP